MADDGGLHPLEEVTSRRRSFRKTSVNSFVVQRNAKIEKREKVKKISDILRKPESERTAAERALVKKQPDIVKASQNNAKRLQATKDRVLEIEDEPEDLARKCDELAELIGESSRIVVYTGAGISTAASIPDYRGPNGVWTLLKKGQEPSAQDLSDAEPTFTHMSITKLFRTGRVKHVVSQNCDGLHIRSGYPRYTMSEVHGNMFIECCYNCEPHREYIRLFDVTEKTGVRRHTTSRKCRACGKYLTDTIVHFGEKGKIKSPYRWKEAVRAAKSSDLILCLGTSLKILRRYTCLWGMDKKPSQRPKLVIVNLQWTPKDDTASLKINGRCDDVMRRVMEKLEYNVPEYRREFDPIFKFCTPLRANEKKTTSKKILVPPSMPSKASVKAAMAKSSKSKKKSKRSSSAETDKSESSSSSTIDVQTVSEESSVKEEEKKHSSADRGENLEEDKKYVPGEALLTEIKSEVIEIKTEEVAEEVMSISMDDDDKEGKDSATNLYYSDSQTRATCSPEVDDKKDVMSKVSSNVFSAIPNHSTCPSVTQSDASVIASNPPVCSNRVFLDQLSSDHHSAPNSLTLNKSILCVPGVDSNSTNHDSIGLLVVSHAPQCLTDVCSLDLNSDNPSVFPVCRIELPAVDETGLINADVDVKKDGQSIRPGFDGGVEEVDDDNNLGLSVVAEAIPSTVVVDLEMMEDVKDGNDHQDKATDHQSPHEAGLYGGPSDMILVNLDQDNWQNERCGKGSLLASNSTTILNDFKNPENVTNNLTLDLDKCDLKHQPHNNLSCHKINSSESSSLYSQMQGVSFLRSALTSDSLSTRCDKPLAVPLMSAICQQKKSISTPCSSTSTSFVEGSKDRIHFSSGSMSWQCALPPKKPQNAQYLSSPQPCSNSISTLPINVKQVQVTKFPLANGLTTTCLKSTLSGSPGARNSSLLPASLLSSPTNTVKCIEHKPLSHVRDEIGNSHLKAKNTTAISQHPRDLQETEFRKVLMSQVSSLFPSSLSMSLSSLLSSSPLSSSSLRQTKCHVSQPRNISESFKNPSTLSINHRTPQVIPKLQQDESDHKLSSNNHEKIIEILNKASGPYIPQSTSTSKGKEETSSPAFIKTEQESLLVNGHDEKKASHLITSSEKCGLSVLAPPQIICERGDKHQLESVSVSQSSSLCSALGKDTVISNNNSTPALHSVSSSPVKIASSSISSKQYVYGRSVHSGGHSPSQKPLSVFGESGYSIGNTISNPQPCPQTSFKSGIASYILNMDDLLTPKSVSPHVPGSESITLPVDKISNTGVERTKQDRRNVSILGAATAQERAFSPESQKPNQATSLVSKALRQQQDSLEYDITLSENTDVPFKDDVISGNGAQTNLSSFCRTNKGNCTKLSPTRSEPVTWKCIQTPPSKRSKNSNAIVLKADWGTPLTTLLQKQDAVCVKTKACTKKKNSLKRSSHCAISPPAPVLTSKLPYSDFDPNLPRVKKAKKTTIKTNKLEKAVKPKKTIAKTTKTKKKTEPVASSLPGWFGKGLAIKRKCKRKIKC